jgi:transcriptional regulator with PAS, ATPase and Fis domain
VAKVVGRDKKYTAVNVAAIGADVFESHLFGHAVGAFSGAVRASRGIFRAHEGGAVFLDEIGEVPLLLQPKLLRLLENREVMPVGESASPVDVLIVAATNRALEDDVERSTFRRDLLARFGRTISMPALRARAEDIHEIARSVLERRGETVNADTVEVEAVERLALAPWLSNIRELASVLNEVARIDARPGLRHEAVASVLRERGDARVPSASTALTRSEAEAAVKTAGSERRAALDLRVSRGTLRRALSREK